MSECAFVCTSRYSFVFVTSMPSTPSPTLTCDNKIKLKIYFIMHKCKHNNPIRVGYKIRFYQPTTHPPGYSV